MVIGLIVMLVVGAILTATVNLLYETKPGWKMSRKLRKFVLTLHVGVSVGWLGAAAAMLALAVAALFTGQPELRRAAYAFMHFYDLAIMIPFGFLSLFTGVFLGAGTHWGIFRHWWIVTKLVLTVAVLTFAGVFTNVWVLSAAETTAANPSADLGVLGAVILINTIAFNVVFWTTMTISVYKPWGTTPAGERYAARRSEKARATGLRTTAKG